MLCDVGGGVKDGSKAALLAVNDWFRAILGSISVFYAGFESLFDDVTQ